MEKRRIDLSRCLVHDGKADCHRCEEICPQKAIKDHVVDTTACDGCGLCSAVCPAAAIVAPEDYEGALTKAQELAPQVLMCEKASEGGVHCLGFLTCRLLWALAAKRQLALDISHCASCRPAVFAHLEREVAACNDALAEAGRKEIALVHVKPAPPKPKKAKKVERRGFFQALFHSTAEGRGGLPQGAAGRAMRAVSWACTAAWLHGLRPLRRRLPDAGARLGARREGSLARRSDGLHGLRSLRAALPAGRPEAFAAVCGTARFPVGLLIGQARIFCIVYCD